MEVKNGGNADAVGTVVVDVVSEDVVSDGAASDEGSTDAVDVTSEGEDSTDSLDVDVVVVDSGLEVGATG